MARLKTIRAMSLTDILDERERHVSKLEKIDAIIAEKRKASRKPTAKAKTPAKPKARATAKGKARTTGKAKGKGATATATAPATVAA